MIRRVYVYRHEQSDGERAYTLTYMRNQGSHACIHDVDSPSGYEARKAAAHEHKEKCGNALTPSGGPLHADRLAARAAILGYQGLPEPTERQAFATEYRVALAIQKAREDERTACWRIAAEKFNECGLLAVQDVFAAIAKRGITAGM